ncbi:MAG: hypothetical protein HGA55_00135 [Methanoregulaceae archaeon]|jgi:uncharacterized ferredoxin-like protein|nr:hypothetical protein [Methanoregulaceae archaeon]
MHPEDDALMTVVSLMALSARTAPKAKGVDSIRARIIPRFELPSLAARMQEIGSEKNLPSFLRDAGNIAAAGACLVIGVTGREPLGLNCQGCGYESCEDMAVAVKNRVPGPSPYQGPNCIFKVTDLGIAIGSAVRTAASHTADNRVMYSVGVAALSLGFLPDCSIAYGIPVSATGKNIFFDRT